jgi:hypothetical protein
LTTGAARVRHNQVHETASASESGVAALSTQEVVTRLAAALQKLEQGQAKAASAAQDFDEARALVGEALHGATAGPLLGLIDTLRAAAQQASRSGMARERVQETIHKAQGLGDF